MQAVASKGMARTPEIPWGSHLCPIWEARKRPPGVGAGYMANPGVGGCMYGMAGHGSEENPWGPIVHLAASEACRAVSQSTHHLSSGLVSIQRYQRNRVTPILIAPNLSTSDLQRHSGMQKNKITTKSASH